VTEKTHKEPNPPEIDVKDFPNAPGCYIMKDVEGTVIYVGKARNLRQRVRSYFQEASSDQRLSIPFLRRRVHSVDFIVTDTEKEALLLENTLIKKYKPRYNVRLRDDKQYLSLRIKPRERFPRLEVVRRRTPGDGAVYFGPFSSSAALKETMRFIQRIFTLRMCKDSQFKNRTRPCLLYEVKKCLGPCTQPVSSKEYRNLVNGVVLFFQGRREDVVKYLKGIMQDYSDQMQFEKAAMIRDKIDAITNTIEQQKVSSYRRFTFDAIGFAREASRVVVSVLHYRNGLLEANRDFYLTVYEEDDAELLGAFVGQFYGPEKFVPPIILLPLKPAEKETLEEWLTELRDGSVKINVPQRGEKKDIVNLAHENARRKLAAERESDTDREALLERVQHALGMRKPPRVVECFDISNIMGMLSVGSMVSFYDGEPDKDNYRMFKIQSVDAPNDYAMMKEVLSRRYKRLRDEGSQTPDLILIDGGKGQLNIALNVMRELGITDVHLAGIAKAQDSESLASTRRNRSLLEQDHIYLPQRKTPLKIKKCSAVLLFLQRIRDEAHRFAITYHKRLRSKKQTASELDTIPGIGKKRRTALLKHFGSIKKIKKATIDELAAVTGISKKIAQQIYNHFHMR
jgi:excinuclease ABC subunit C